MLNIKLICLGKLKEPYLRDMCAEYVKRLGGYCKFTIKELPAERLPDAPSASQIAAALQKEAAQILSSVTPADKVVALCIEGKAMSSEALSRQLEGFALGGSAGIVFVIGSSFGLAPSVKERADVRLSMSPMTFPHQLARAMLLEQIYRALSISAGTKYHK